MAPRRLAARLCALMLLAGPVGLATPAAARTMSVTYSGSILGGYDQFGDLGAAGADLTGLGYSLSFRYDTAAGQRQTQAGTSDQLFGGTYLGSASPILSTVLTLGGRGVGFGASYAAAILNDIVPNGPFFADPGGALPTGMRFAAQSVDRGTDPLTGQFASSSLWASCNGPSTAFPAPNLETAFATTCAPGEAGSVLFFQVGSNGLVSNVAANLSVSQMVVRDVSVAPVPLPAAGGMLALGLGALALRRRKAA